jgi:Flp pilus assembly protein TadB
MAADGEKAGREVALPTDAEFAAESEALDAEVVKLAELRTDVEKLFAPPPAQPLVRVVNQFEGLADALLRIVLAFALFTAVLVALALFVSPWFWIGVAAWLIYAGVAIGWLVRNRRANRPKAITTAPTLRRRRGAWR